MCICLGSSQQPCQPGNGGNECAESLDDQVTEENTDDGSNSGEIVERKGQRSSVVWRYFGYLKSDKKHSSAHCKLCRKHAPIKSGNTTNLFYHLKQCHPVEHAHSLTKSANSSSKTTRGIPAKQQQSIESAFPSVLPYDKKAKRHSDITNAIAYCLAKDMLLINTVENEGFKQLIKVTDPRYLPGRNIYSCTLDVHLGFKECSVSIFILKLFEKLSYTTRRD